MNKFKIGDKVFVKDSGYSFDNTVAIVCEIVEEGLYKINHACGYHKEADFHIYEENISLWTDPEVISEPQQPHGGPSSYYDMPFKDWITVNDQMEYLAANKWGKYGIHLKDIFKGICRWGEKSGTTVEYDTRKIIYYGLRIYRMLVGNKGVQEYLKELANDPQFKE